MFDEIKRHFPRLCPQNEERFTFVMIVNDIELYNVTTSYLQILNSSSKSFKKFTQYALKFYMYSHSNI